MARYSELVPRHYSTYRVTSGAAREVSADMNISWSMNQDAVYRKLTGHDGYSRPTYEDDVPFKGRVQFKQKLVRAASGQEVMSEAEVWLPLDPSIDPNRADDEIEFQGIKIKTINIGKKADIHGQDCYWKAYCVSQG